MQHLDALFTYFWCLLGLIVTLQARASLKSKVEIWEWVLMWAGWPGVCLVLIYYGLQKKV